MSLLDFSLILGGGIIAALLIANLMAWFGDKIDAAISEWMGEE